MNAVVCFFTQLVLTHYSISTI